MSAKDTYISFSFLMVGAAVGAAITLLYAPKTGKETRKLFSRGLENGMDRLEETGRRVSRRVEQALESGREFANRLVM